MKKKCKTSKTLRLCIHTLSSIKEGKREGITLVALVVTIVVLLILAGITLVYVFGDNGAFGKASQSKLETEISKIEEAANIHYQSWAIKKHAGEINEIPMSEIVASLTKEGFEIESRKASANAITGIKVEPEEIALANNGTNTIKVILEESKEGFLYYAKIDGKHYPIYLIEGGVKVDRKAKNPEGTTDDTKAKVVGGYDEDIVVNTAINGNEITLTGGTGEGTTTITIKYGEHTASCTVKISPKASSITAKDVTIAEGTSQKIEVEVTPSDAAIKLKYETTDTAKITLQEDGTVTAKNLEGKQKDTATVTITDEITGKNTICTITIDSLVGTFIQYDVAYKDMYIEANYTTNNGWRLLDYTKNADGTLSNVKLISTGIPAMLFSGGSTETNNDQWWETDVAKLNEFKNNILGSEYKTYTGAKADYSNYSAIRASAGLYYNFGSINFIYNTSAESNFNKGYYTYIKKGTTAYGVNTNATGKDLFETSVAKENRVRLITLPELNKAIGRNDIDSMDEMPQAKDSKGIYRLEQLKNVLGDTMPSYNNSTHAYYWIASPYSSEKYQDSAQILCIGDTGGIASSNAYFYGVRPVVELKGDNLILEEVPESPGTYQLK